MSGGCKDCKRVREHVASLLPFRVLEAVAGKPLRISGVALSAGVSRNFNVYTVEELQAFASELVNSPVYIEHVSVENATGKVTKCTYDPTSRCLMYEAEIYDQVTADKIRNGLIQHVSVGADYDTLDTVDANVPHGLHNAELSLVAVPGIPEANIMVLEHLMKGLSEVKLPVKEQLEPQMPGEYLLGFCQDSALFLSEHFRIIWLDQANGVLAVMAKTRADPALERCQAILFLKVKWQPNTVADWLSIHPDYQVAAGASVGLGVQGNGVEKLEEKDMDKIAEKVAAKVSVKESAEAAKLSGDLAEAKNKLVEAEGKVKTAEALAADTASKLEVANKAVEDLRKQLPGGGLLKDPPVLMQVSEHVAVLETLLPPVVVERSSIGMQRQGQAVRSAILKAQKRLKAK